MARTLLFPLTSYAPTSRSFGPLPIPVGLSSVRIEWDITSHTDPTIELRINTELSLNNGVSWRYFFGFTRLGGVGRDDDGSVSTLSYMKVNIPQPLSTQRQLRGVFVLTGGSLTTSGTLVVV